MPMSTVDAAKLAAMDANLDPGIVANSEALQPSLDNIASVTNTNAGVFNTHQSAVVLDHPDGSVTSAKIADAAVTTAKITDANVTTAKLADSSVTSAKIADGTIVDVDINAAAAIAWSKINKTASSLADLTTRLSSDLTTDSTHRFTTDADISKLSTLTPTGLGSYSIPVGQVFPLWSRYSQEQDPVTGEMVFYEI